MKQMAVVGRLAVAAVIIALSGAPASAQDVPSATVQEIIIKTSLLTFNDANETGNYDVLHARLSKPFRDQFPPEKLAAVFKAFRDRHAYLDLIAAKPPIAAEPAKIDNQGLLTLKGYFDTSPSRVNYDLAFILEGDEWRLVRINVDLKGAGK
jgi:hypothetical protein